MFCKRIVKDYEMRICNVEKGKRIIGKKSRIEVKKR